MNHAMNMNTRRSATTSRLMPVLLALLVCLAACATQSPTLSGRSAPAPTNLPAYDFMLAALDGRTIRLSDYRGRSVLVNFWATWCVPCREEMPLLERSMREFGPGLAVLGVNMRETPDEVRRFAAQYGITFPLLLNPDDATLLAYLVRGLPVTFVIGPDGALLERIDGPMTRAVIERITRAR